MKWEEFRDLLIGIGPDTPLGRIVAIRAEEDREILKHFSKEQIRIRNEWRCRHSKTVSIKDRNTLLEELKQALMELAGGKTS